MLVRHVYKNNLQKCRYDVLVNGKKVARWTSGCMYEVAEEGVITVILMRWLVDVLKHHEADLRVTIKRAGRSMEILFDLIYGADESGKDEPGAQEWADAKIVIEQQPDQWRVIEYMRRDEMPRCFNLRLKSTNQVMKPAASERHEKERAMFCLWVRPKRIDQTARQMEWTKGRWTYLLLGYYRGHEIKLSR